LGAVLAYSLHREGTQNRGREKLFEILSHSDPAGSSIVLAFGEIDCRWHLLKQAETRSLALKEVVTECVDKYFQVILEVRNLGFETMVWNSIPTTYEGTNPDYPHYGTHLQRNECTRLFNGLLAERCKKEKVFFIDIFDKLVDRKNYTKAYYLFDGAHLGQLAMPFFIKRIRALYPHIKLPSGGKVKWYYHFAQIYTNRKFIDLKRWIKWNLKLHS